MPISRQYNMSSKVLQISTLPSSSAGQNRGKEQRQVVDEVIDFSSQYGGSRSYAACNLVGEGFNFPNYGDFSESFVLRTYGGWWNRTPSAEGRPFRNSTTFISQDFVEVKFGKPVYPTKLEVLETYNPGAVVRILACNCTDLSIQQFNLFPKLRWFVLWSGPHVKEPHSSRRFAPPLKSCPFPTNLIRIEFNQDYLDYYTEIDAIILYGFEIEASCNKDKAKPTILQEAVTLLKQLSLADKTKESKVKDNGFFDILPSELISLIFSYMSLQDVLIASGTCRLFRQYCYDASWYKKLNLQPYWDKVTDAGLDGLQGRCAGTTEVLSLNWCGGHHMISSQGFSRFINFSGSQLRVLNLACCKFLDHPSLSAIAMSCHKLEDLDLQSCVDIPSAALSEIAKLTNLRSLNLYSVHVFGDVVSCIVRSCTKLQHLNLGGCSWIQDYDEILEDVGRHCRDLRSIDLWRAKSLTDAGLYALAIGCSNLEEVDIGWCTNVRCRQGFVVKLIKLCRNLKKLFLTAVRTVSDAELEAVSKYCPEMEQLDILGTALVTPDCVERVLETCKHLKFLDLSFCSQLSKSIIDSWRKTYPLVSIKWSFVSE